MLRYCAWCNRFLGFVPGEGSQLQPNYCQIVTSTICPACREHFESQLPAGTLTPPAVAD